MRYNFAAEFLYNETLQQTIRPLLWKLSKRQQIYALYPHFEEVKGGVEPWLMAHWKARVESLSLNFFFCLLRLRRYKAKCVKTRMWANAQPDGRPAEHRWRPLFNAAKFG